MSPGLQGGPPEVPPQLCWGLQGSDECASTLAQMCRVPMSLWAEKLKTKTQATEGGIPSLAPEVGDGGLKAPEEWGFPQASPHMGGEVPGFLPASSQQVLGQGRVWGPSDLDNGSM